MRSSKLWVMAEVEGHNDNGKAIDKPLHIRKDSYLENDLGSGADASRGETQASEVDSGAAPCVCALVN
jgi:hypothetical protein